MRSIGLAIVLSGVFSLAGCPTPTPTPSGPAQTAGAWTGDLSCDVTQSLSGAAGNPVNAARAFSTTINDSGVPTSVRVLGFTGGPDQDAAISQVGDSATLNSTSGNLAITQIVTVTQARYTSTSADITLSIEYSATGGALSQNGTATQTIAIRVSGANLTYSANVNYSVTQLAGTITLDTGEVTDCNGVLSKQ